MDCRVRRLHRVHAVTFAVAGRQRGGNQRFGQPALPELSARAFGRGKNAAGADRRTHPPFRRSARRRAARRPAAAAVAAGQPAGAGADGGFGKPVAKRSQTGFSGCLLGAQNQFGAAGRLSAHSGRHRGGGGAHQRGLYHLAARIPKRPARAGAGEFGGNDLADAHLDYRALAGAAARRAGGARRRFRRADAGGRLVRVFRGKRRLQPDEHAAGAAVQRLGAAGGGKKRRIWSAKTSS